MDDVIVLGGVLGALDEGCGVFDGCDMVRRQVEVVGGEFVHDGVNFHNRGFDAVLYQRGRGRAHSESTSIQLARAKCDLILGQLT